MNKKMFFLKNESFDKLSSVWCTPKEQILQEKSYNRQIHNLLFGEMIGIDYVRSVVEDSLKNKNEQ